MASFTFSVILLGDQKRKNGRRGIRELKQKNIGLISIMVTEVLSKYVNSYLNFFNDNNHPNI